MSNPAPEQSPEPEQSSVLDCSKSNFVLVGGSVLDWCGVSNYQLASKNRPKTEDYRLKTKKQDTINKLITYAVISRYFYGVGCFLSTKEIEK